MTTTLTALGLCVLLLASALTLDAQKRKGKKKQDEEPRPQVLAVLPDPPDAITAESARIVYQVSPLSDKGLLSQQVRDALKALERQLKGASFVKLRAFVAGSGDLRRVKEIVSEELTERKQPLPVVSTIQVGALPMIGAQVVIEATAMDRKVMNPGLAFFSGTSAKNPGDSIDQLQQAVQKAGVKPTDVLRVTCFLSALDQMLAARTGAAAFPAAAVNFVQMQRLGIEPQVACEAVGRLGVTPPAPVTVTNGTALVNGKMAITETQLAFRNQDDDYRLAFQRLIKTLGGQSASIKDVFWSGTYSLTRPTANKVETIRWEVLDRTHPPAGTSLLFEGLPSTDATAAIELMAIRN